MKRAVVLAFAACSRREPIASCDDDLRGVYAAGDERWMMIDSGEVLEAYPLFPDGADPILDGSLTAGSATVSVGALGITTISGEVYMPDLPTKPA